MIYPICLKRFIISSLDHYHYNLTSLYPPRESSPYLYHTARAAQPRPLYSYKQGPEVITAVCWNDGSSRGFSFNKEILTSGNFWGICLIAWLFTRCRVALHTKKSYRWVALGVSYNAMYIDYVQNHLNLVICGQLHAVRPVSDGFVVSLSLHQPCPHHLQRKRNLSS